MTSKREGLMKKLAEFLERTGADELMINAMIFDHQSGSVPTGSWPK